MQQGVYKMISSKLKDKIYGTVHDEHNFRYIGFCKKVRSDEIQSVDVWINGKKVEMLKCDKTINKISQVYDKAGFAFQYDLPDEYIGQKYLVSFTCNGAELENSPIWTIIKEDNSYNECKFMHGLGETVDKDITKDLYSLNTVGFLSTGEILKDKDYVAYIRELMDSFPHIEFKGFCFNDYEEKLTHALIGNIHTSIIYHPKQFVESVYVILFSVYFKGWKELTKYAVINKVSPIVYDSNTKKNGSIALFDYFQIDGFGFSDAEKEASDKNIYKLLHLYSLEKYNYLFNIKQDFFTHVYYDNAKLVIEYEDFRERYCRIIGYQCRNF